MVTINGKRFYDKPGSCGACPFMSSGRTSLTYTDKGHCTLWDENHGLHINPPKRCQKLFNKAFRKFDGAELVIVSNTDKDYGE